MVHWKYSKVCRIRCYSVHRCNFFFINSKQRQKEGFAYCMHLKARERALQLEPPLCVRVCVCVLRVLFAKCELLYMC